MSSTVSHACLSDMKSAAPLIYLTLCRWPDHAHLDLSSGLKVSTLHCLSVLSQRSLKPLMHQLYAKGITPDA